MQQHGCKYFARRPLSPPHPTPPPPPQPQLFQNIVMLHIKLKRIMNAATWYQILNILPADPTPLTLGLGSKGQYSTFSEHGHVAYQIKGEKNLEVVIFHIKLMGLEHRAPYKHIFCPYTHTGTLGLGQKVKTYFLLKVVMLHIKLKGIEHRAPCKQIFCPYTHPHPPDGVKRSKHFFSESSHVAYIKYLTSGSG